MSFKFSFAAVLRFRQTLEERDKLALERIQHEIARLTRLLEQVEIEKAKDARTRELELSGGIPAAHILAIEAARQRLQQSKKQLEEQLGKLRAEREKKLLAYNTSRRNREMLSELRQQQWEEYESQEARRQQKIMDDLFLSRRQKWARFT